MKKNLYYRTVFRRDNVLKLFLLSLFYLFSSYPRLLLEVFIRKNFGERYFKLSSAVTVTAILALWPVVIGKLSAYSDAISFAFGGMGGNPYSPQSLDPSGHVSLMPHYLGWYIFLALFVLLSIKHHRDMKRNPSVFDFKKFSLYMGKTNPAFYKIQLFGKEPTHRQVECFIEPAAFFIAGILLHLIGQNLGNLLMVSSVFYSLSYVAAYAGGDHFVMDKIDEIICNEELEKSFVNDVDEDETRGFRFRGQKPENHDMRRKILPLMADDEEILEAR